MKKLQIKLDFQFRIINKGDIWPSMNVSPRTQNALILSL